MPYFDLVHDGGPHDSIHNIYVPARTSHRQNILKGSSRNRVGAFEGS
jgi:hypothetical protein